MKEIPAICFFTASVLAVPVAAAPPFVTDDPEPVDYQHVELDFFSRATHIKNETSGMLPALETDYGAVPNLELHMVVADAFDAAKGQAFQYGFGDSEFGFKYKFIHQENEGWQPDIAIAPLMQAPTGDASRHLGNGNMREFLPLWALKDFGVWETHGGGGYWNNPGAGNKNYWFAGWVLQRKITDALQLGGEIFHQTSNKIGVQDSSGFNLGGTYDLSSIYHITFAAGRGVQNAADTNQFSYYLGLQMTY